MGRSNPQVSAKLDWIVIDHCWIGLPRVKATGSPFNACWLEFCIDTSAENERGNGKSQFLIGDTSSKGWFSIVI